MTFTGYWRRWTIAVVAAAVLLGSVTAGTATGSPRPAQGADRHSQKQKQKHQRKSKNKKGCNAAGARRLCVDLATLSPIINGDGATQLKVYASVKDSTPYRDNLVIYLARNGCQSSYASAERYVNSVGLSAFLSDQSVGGDLTSSDTQGTKNPKAGTFVLTTAGRGNSFHIACALIYTTRGGNPSGDPYGPTTPITHPTYVHAGRSITQGPPVQPIGSSPDPCATSYYCTPGS
jgi:hypothetical protein